MTQNCIVSTKIVSVMWHEFTLCPHHSLITLTTHNASTAESDDNFQTLLTFLITTRKQASALCRCVDAFSTDATYQSLCRSVVQTG